MSKEFSLAEYESSRTKKKQPIIIRKSLKDLSEDAKRKDIRILVAFYLRVSTKHKPQEQALKEQKKYMEIVEKRHPEWLVTWYIDFGKTGTNFNRNEFVRMKQDAENKKFVYIVTREVSRFARNTSLTLVETDTLRDDYDIGVYFLFDEIDTLIMSERSKLVDKAKQSEEEAWRTSLRVHATLDNQIDYDEDGKAFGPPRSGGGTFGYKSDLDSKYYWKLDNEQAETIRFIFDLAKKEYTLREIRVQLEKQRRRTDEGNYRWFESTINKIIHNPIYIGLQYQNKQTILPENFLSKERTNLSKKNWILVDVSKYVPALITQDDFLKVQEIFKNKENIRFKKKSLDDLKSNNKSIWSSLLVCACGSSYRKEGSNSNIGKIMYRCYNQINHGSLAVRKKQGLDITGACDIKSIPCWKLMLMEHRIKKLLFTDRKALIEQILNCFKKYYVQDTPNNNSNQIESIKDNINKYNQRKNSINRLFANGDMEEEDYLYTLNEIKGQINILNNQLSNLEKENQEVDFSEKMKLIEECLNQFLDDCHSDDNFLYTIVEAIVHVEDNKFIWLLNFSDELNDADLEEQDKVIFIKKKNFCLKKIVKSKKSLLTSFKISVEEARNFKYELKAGFVKRWEDIEVEVYL